jgi:hypothetical protein
MFAKIYALVVETLDQLPYHTIYHWAIYYIDYDFVQVRLDSKDLKVFTRHKALYSSQQNHSNVFNLWKDALILHEINSGRFWEN